MERISTGKVCLAIYHVIVLMCVVKFYVVSYQDNRDHAIYNITPGYQYHKTEKRIMGPRNIPEIITKFDSDDNFIIAEQELPESEGYVYWIIDKRDNNLIGPCDYDTFISECKKNGVDATLNRSYL